MTTTLTPFERAEKAQQTTRAKQAAAEARYVPLRSFVRIRGGHPAYRGRVGVLREYNDLNDPKTPDKIPVEAGVSFSAGPNALKVWFYPHQLERADKPKNWDPPPDPAS